MGMPLANRQMVDRAAHEIARPRPSMRTQVRYGMHRQTYDDPRVSILPTIYRTVTRLDWSERRQSVLKRLSRRAFLGMLLATVIVVPSLADTEFTLFAFPITGGTTNRTMPNRLGDFHNVLEYGADPTGRSDSSAGVQRACDAASNGVAVGVIFFPEGNYTFTRGVNLDKYGGNVSFIICGVGASTNAGLVAGSKIRGAIKDYFFRRVYGDAGSIGYTKSISNLWMLNNNTSFGPPLAISSITANGREIDASFTTPHGITVGDTRQIVIDGVSASDSYNGTWGCQATSTTAVKILYTVQSLPGGKNGTARITPGGCVAMISLRGTLEHCYLSGFYGFSGPRDCYFSINDCQVAGLSRAIGSIGIWLSGGAVRDCDITSWDRGVYTSPTGGFILQGLRVEINNTGIASSGGSAAHITGSSFEQNRTAIYLRGCGTHVLESIAILGESGIVTAQYGIHFENVTYSTVRNVNIGNTFTGSCIKQEVSNCQGTRIIGCNFSNTGAGTQCDFVHTGLQIIDCNFGEGYTVSQLPLAASISPPIDGDELTVIDNDDAAWTGSASNVAKPVAHTTGSKSVLARYSLRTNSWTIAGAA